jgi:DNA invertase Pin-like site-specific DNA recombinase
MRYAARLQAEQGDTNIEEQRTRCDEVGQRFGWEKVDAFVDRNRAGTSVSERPDLMRLLDVAREGKLDVVIVEQLARLSRNAADTHYICKCLEDYGVRVFSVADGGYIGTMHVPFRATSKAAATKGGGL